MVVDVAHVPAGIGRSDVGYRDIQALPFVFHARMPSCLISVS